MLLECRTHQGGGRINGYLKFFIESDHWNWGPTIWNLTDSERNSIRGTIEEKRIFYEAVMQISQTIEIWQSKEINANIMRIFKNKKIFYFLPWASPWFRLWETFILSVLIAPLLESEEGKRLTFVAKHFWENLFVTRAARYIVIKLINLSRLSSPDAAGGWNISLRVCPAGGRLEELDWKLY